jgi:hypothetical protein
MKESEFNNEVLHKLADFEQVGNILPSKEWNDALVSRIAMIKSKTSSKHLVTKYTFIIILIILINIGFILNSFIRITNHSSGRNNELNVISKELMVNPVSINI